MRRVGSVLAAVLLVGVCCAFAGQGSESLVLPVEGKYGEVAFPHWNHQATLGDCNTCHGMFPQETGAIDRLIADNGLKKKQVMNNCRACHRTTAKTGNPSGPVKCFDCHAKG